MKNVVLIIFFVCLTGCAASVPPAVIKPVTHLEPITIKNDNSKLIFISEITSGYKNAEESIGQYKTGTLCVGGEKLYWTPNDSHFDQYRIILRENLEKYGYRVASDLFEEESSSKADILMGARVVNIKGNICKSPNAAKGEIYMQVEWEVFDKESKEIVKIKTEGNGNVPEFELQGDPGVFLKAFSMAVVNLLAIDDFYKIAHLD